MPGPSSRKPKGVPVKVWRVANAVRRGNPRTSDAKAYRIAWATVHHTINRRGKRKGSVKSRRKRR